MAEYSEIEPSPRLSKHVECFWFLDPSSRDPDHRVLPDGCTDLVFSVAGGHVRGSVVGAMTRALVESFTPGQKVFGVRFHPAMSHGLLRAAVAELTDQTIDLGSIWGKDGRELEQRLSDSDSREERVSAIEAALQPCDAETPVQRAALWIVANHGNAPAEALARHAGLSARQFRRLCIEQTGVGPKMLCRIVRFRNAANDIAGQVVDWAAFALDHGYYDQAHFINEFREFSGVTPVEYANYAFGIVERAIQVASRPRKGTIPPV